MTTDGEVTGDTRFPVAVILIASGAPPSTQCHRMQKQLAKAKRRSHDAKIKRNFCFWKWANSSKKSREIIEIAFSECVLQRSMHDVSREIQLQLCMGDAWLYCKFYIFWQIRASSWILFWRLLSAAQWNFAWWRFWTWNILKRVLLVVLLGSF